jgi:hypothetical protein
VSLFLRDGVRGELVGLGEGRLRVLIGVVFLAEGAVGTLDVSFRGMFVYPKKLR